MNSKVILDCSKFEQFKLTDTLKKEDMRPTVYKPEYPELFIKICKEGGSICDFCVVAEIARSTFYEWLEAHEEFKQAYNIGREITEQWLTRTGIEGMRGELNDFNATAWSMLMRNKCGMTADRKVAIDFTGCKTANEKMAVLDARVREGRLTTAEAKHWAEYIAASVKIDENTDGKQRLEAVEESLGIKK